MFEVLIENTITNTKETYIYDSFNQVLALLLLYSNIDSGIIIKIKVN